MNKKNFIFTTKNNQKFVSIFIILMASLFYINSYTMNDGLIIETETKESENRRTSISSHISKKGQEELPSKEKTLPNYMLNLHEKLADSTSELTFCDQFTFLCTFFCLDLFENLKNIFKKLLEDKTKKKEKLKHE